jgi:hypothetical protein
MLRFGRWTAILARAAGVTDASLRARGDAPKENDSSGEPEMTASLNTRLIEKRGAGPSRPSRRPPARSRLREAVGFLLATMFALSLIVSRAAAAPPQVGVVTFVVETSPGQHGVRGCTATIVHSASGDILVGARHCFDGEVWPLNSGGGGGAPTANVEKLEFAPTHQGPCAEGQQVATCTTQGASNPNGVWYAVAKDVFYTPPETPFNELHDVAFIRVYPDPDHNTSSVPIEQHVAGLNPSFDQGPYQDYRDFPGANWTVYGYPIDTANAAQYLTLLQCSGTTGSTGGGNSGQLIKIACNFNSQYFGGNNPVGGISGGPWLDHNGSIGAVTRSADGPIGTQPQTHVEAEPLAKQAEALFSQATSPPPRPVCSQINQTTSFQFPVTVKLSCKAASGQPMRFTFASPPTHGTVTMVKSTATPWTSADGKVKYTPAPGYYGPDAFTYTATDGTSTSNQATVSLTVAPPPPSWSGSAFESFGGRWPSSDDIALSANADGRLQLFMVGEGENQSLYTDYQREVNGGWLPPGTFEPFGGDWPNSDDIALSANADGRQQLFLVGKNLSLYTDYQTQINGGWLGFGKFESFGGEWPNSDRIALGPNADGRLELFMVGKNHSLYTDYQTEVNGGWLPRPEKFRSFGGSWSNLQDIGLGSNADGRLQLFMINPANSQLETDYQVEKNGGWSGFTVSLRGTWSTTDSVAVASNQNATMQVFLIGQNGRLYTRYQEQINGGFACKVEGCWEDLGGTWPAGDSVAVAPDAQGLLNLFLIGKNGALYTKKQTSVNGAFGATWESLGESLAGRWSATDSLAVAPNQDGRLQIFLVGPDRQLYTIYQH